DAAARADGGDDGWRIPAALAWLAAVRVSERVGRACHQAFGSLGFCYESGLVELTWGMTWLRSSVGSKRARRFLGAARREAAAARRGRPPGCLVLEGFGLEPALV